MTILNFTRRGILFSVAVFFSASLSIQAAKPGTSAANFLKIGTGARGAAMADAQSALSNDVNSLYWNPAGLSLLRYNELSVMHYSLVENVRYQQGAIGIPTNGHGTIAFGINLLDYGDIQGYDNAALPTGKVDAKNLMFSASWAKQMLKKSNLRGGATLKYLQSELAGYKASAAIFDLGVLYPFETGDLRGLNLAATVRNMGQPLKYDHESSDLPQQIVLGAGYSALGGNLNFGFDMVQPKDNDSYLAAGVEYRVLQLLHLRAGYNNKTNFVGNGLTYGMGLRFNQWNIDYAFVPYGELGNTNRVSVGVRFGRAIQMTDAGDQVDAAFKKAERQLALGKGVEAYSTLSELLLIAPWHQPSVDLKARIEKQFIEMSASKNRARMDAQIADTFTQAKASFDRDELVDAKKGFETILKLQPDHIGSTIYLERIQNRYASLAQEAFKEGMAFFAAGDYGKAKAAFEKTMTIDPWHKDAKAQLETTKQVIVDSTRRRTEMQRLEGAQKAYKDGLDAYQKNDFETALKKFDEVQALSPEYEEVGRYQTVTRQSLGNVFFEQSQVHMENGQFDLAVAKLRRALELVPADSRVKPALDIAVQELNTKNAEESKRLYQNGLEAYLGGDTAKAEKLWKRALELNSDNEDALKALTKLEEQKSHENKKED